LIFTLSDFIFEDHISEPIAKDITFPLTVGDTVSVVCSLVLGGAYAAGRYSSELSGAQDRELILKFGARYFPVTSIKHGVVRYNITKNGVSNKSFNRSLNIAFSNCLG